MSGQPDLILQLAHHIRDDFERRGQGPVEVRVDALVSLNGRARPAHRSRGRPRDGDGRPRACTLDPPGAE